MNIYRKVLIGSIVAYILGITVVIFSTLFIPNTIFKWKATLQISTPAIFLIGILCIRQKFEWETYKYVIIGFGLVPLLLTLFRVIPTSVFILTILALGGIYSSSSAKLEELISAT